METLADYNLESTLEHPMTPETAIEAGIKFGSTYKTIAVTRDSDPSSKMMEDALISGLLAAGATIIDAGMSAVPAAHMALSEEYECLLSVGNPDKDGKICGIRAYDRDGAPVKTEKLLEILRKRDCELPDYHGIGHVSPCDSIDDRYIQRIIGTGVTAQSYVILDCGCGNTSSCVPRLLMKIGADVVALNAHRCDKQLPRAPGLDKSSFMNISNFVNASIGSIGIAFNGDGTKLALMDESGKYVPGDRLLALLLMYLEPKTAVVPFDAPCVIEDAFRHPLGLKGDTECNQEDRALIRSNGDLDSIITIMKETNAEFGALTDGTFIFSKLGYCPDAMYAASVISELAGKRSIRNVLEEIPIYSSRTVKIGFDGNLTLFSNKLRERIKNYKVTEFCTLGNSWKVILKQGTYVIKPSKFDDKKLVILAESSDSVYLITMLEQAKDLIALCT